MSAIRMEIGRTSPNLWANPYPFVIAQIPSVDGSIIVTGIPIKKMLGLLSLLSMEITVTGGTVYISMESPEKFNGYSHLY